MSDRLTELLDFIIQQAADIDDHNLALSNILKKILISLECDRAWCLYPCDPDTKTWRVPMEETRYEWPGAKNTDMEIPTTAPDIEVFNLFLNAGEPVTFGRKADHPVPVNAQESFSVKAQMAMVIYPENDRPWLLGVHYCSQPHIFTEKERHDFETLGNAIAEKLDQIKF